MFRFNNRVLYDGGRIQTKLFCVKCFLGKMWRGIFFVICSIWWVFWNKISFDVFIVVFVLDSKEFLGKVSHKILTRTWLLSGVSKSHSVDVFCGFNSIQNPFQIHKIMKINSKLKMNLKNYSINFWQVMEKLLNFLHFSPLIFSFWIFIKEL